MGEAPFTPPGGAPPDGGSASGSGTDGAPQEVLDKLEALLGRLRGPDSPAEHARAHPEIPTLDQPVTWTSPEASPEAVPAARQIPTLTEAVELQAARETRAAPTGGPLPEQASLAAPEPEAMPEPEAGHAPEADSVPEAEAAREPSPPPLSPSAPPPDPTTRQELRERVESMLDPALEDRLCERALADLDRTLIDVERGFRDELATWRADQEAEIRDRVRGEIERAVDEVVAALARERGNGHR